MTFEPNTVYRFITHINWIWFKPRSGPCVAFRKGDVFCYVGPETRRLRMPKGMRQFLPGAAATKHQIILENGLPVTMALPSLVYPLEEYVEDLSKTEQNQ